MAETPLPPRVGLPTPESVLSAFTLEPPAAAAAAELPASPATTYQVLRTDLMIRTTPRQGSSRPRSLGPRSIPGNSIGGLGINTVARHARPRRFPYPPRKARHFPTLSN